ncbi:MAG: helix-turn-helix domain-containing protein [Gemmatimonadota bacterium]|jgi:transcriptional regulator with XRE-family HTH domain
MNPFRRQQTDRAVLSEVAARLNAARLSRDLTQAELAHEAGVSKRTVERLEAGESTQLTSFIRVLRALDLLERLEALLPEARPGPMDLLRREGQAPQRASGRRTPPPEPWTWGEDV